MFRPAEIGGKWSANLFCLGDRHLGQIVNENSSACPFKDLVLLVELLLKLIVDIGSGVLVLLVLRDKVVHVGLGLSELHLVHALTSVPVEEGLPPEHGSELFGDPLEQFLDGG